MMLYGLLLLLGTCLAGTQGACPDDFAVIGEGCYSFKNDVSLSWQNAFNYCANMTTPAHLAIIKEANTLRAFYEYIAAFGLKGSFWLGASDLDFDDDWHWIDATRVDRGTPFWAISSGLLGWSQEPEGQTEENCLSLDEERLYYFNDVSCEIRFHPVCQQA